MKVSTIFAESLEPATRRIKSSAAAVLASLFANNAGRSTFAVTGTVDELSKTLNKELRDCFTRVHQLRIGISELRAIKNELIVFVDRIFVDWKNELIKHQAYGIGGEATIQQHDEFIEKRVLEAKNVINLEFLIAREKIRARRRQLSWDIGKIAITAVVGGFIGAYIKMLIP
ncbi:hypothetical protein [Paenibacillus sp. FSL R10-2748]|uniref:hypothetical protein n=1 Tax=Paenibacillus sp. FSL R10-2748 TaxID=2954658 RepID=UPI0030FCA30C